MDQQSTDSPIAMFMGVASAPSVWASALSVVPTMQFQGLAHVNPTYFCKMVPAKRALLTSGVVTQMEHVSAVVQLLTSGS